ncbi:mucin-22-like [Haliotis asinina]|uniref:mucin-22-like n=1 Tax=Haliotis asinina TaxID=109174 RepID=UPI003532024A
MSPRSHVALGRTLVLVLCCSLGQAQQQSQTEVETQEVAQGQGPIVYHARIRPGQAIQGANVATAATEAPDIEAPEVAQGQTAPGVQAGGPNSLGGATYPPNYEYEAPETPEVTSPLPTTGARVPETHRQTVLIRKPSYNHQQARGTAGSESASVQSTPATSAGQQHQHQIITQATNAAKTHLMRNLFEQFRKMAEYHQYDMQKMRAAMQSPSSLSVSGQRGVYNAGQGSSSSGQSRTSVYDAGQGNMQTSTSGQSGTSVYDAGQGSMQPSTSGQSRALVYDAPQGNMQISTSGQSRTSVYDAGQGSMQPSTSGQSRALVYDAPQGNMQISTSGQSRTSVYDAGQGSMQTSTPSAIWVPVYLAGQWTKQKYNPGQTESPAVQTSSQPIEQTTVPLQIGAQYSDATGAQTPVNDQTGAQTTTSAPIQVDAQTPASISQIGEHFSEVYSRPKTHVSGQATTQTAPAAGQDMSPVTDHPPIAIKEIVPVKAVENSVNAKLSHPLEPRRSPVPYADPYTGTGNILEPISNAEFGAIMQRMLVQRLRKYIKSQRKFPAYNPVP